MSGSSPIRTDSINFSDTESAFSHFSDAQLRKAHRLFKLLSNNHLVDMGKLLSGIALKLHFPLAPFVKPTIYAQFCGGESIEECLPMAESMRSKGVNMIVNYGVEGSETNRTFDKTLAENLKVVSIVGDGINISAICVKLTGFGKMAIFEKLQKGEELSPVELKWHTLTLERLHSLCSKASESGVKVFIDAEESWVQDTLDHITVELMLAYNKEQPIVYNTFQLYRKDRLSFLKKSLSEAQDKGYFLGAKIVRGAYMEKERKRARKMGYESPIHETIADVHQDFNHSLKLCLENLEAIGLCVATHNEESCRYYHDLLNELGIPKKHPHLMNAQLLGMGDNLTLNLAKHGHQATKYVPYGPVAEVIPYLIRRAEENSSVEGQMSRELQLLATEIQRRRQAKRKS